MYTIKKSYSNSNKSIGNIWNYSRLHGNNIFKLMIVVLALAATTTFAQTPVAPSDNSTGVSISLSQINWTRFHIGGDSVSLWKGGLRGGGGVQVGLTQTVADTFVNISAFGSPLENNKDYYWYVKDTSSATEGVYHFKTVPATPVLVTPANNATGVAVNVALNWNTVSGGDHYKLKVSTSIGFPADTAVTKTVFFGNISTSGALSLNYNTVYYWRVSASNDGGVNFGLPSASSSFRTAAIPSPVMVYPINNLDGVSILPEIKWTWPGSGTGVTYNVALSPASGLTNPGALDTVGYQWREANGFLTNGTVYTCTVTAHQGSDSGSTVITFTTVPKVNVILSYPADSSTKINYSSAFFSWYNTSVLGGLQYKLQAVAKEGATAPTETEWYAVVAAIYTGTDLSFTSVLTANSKYWWRVLVVDTHNNIVSKSSVNTFTTDGSPVTPVLSYPLSGTVYTNTPTLYWYTNSGFDLNNVRFYVSIYSSNDSLLHEAYDAGTALSFDVPGGLLLPGTTYKWKVGSTSTHGVISTVYSEVKSFTTAGAGTVYKPTLSYPTGGVAVTVYTTNPTFYWYIGTYTSGVNYKVKISTGTGGSFDGAIVHTSADQLDLFSYELTGFSLTPGVTYHWKVIPNASVVYTSNEGTFTVSNSLGIGVPVASYPKGNSTLYTNFPTLYWYMNGNSTGITGYKVSWSTNPAQTWPSDTVATVTGVDQISYKIIAPLTYGTHYYWAVAGLNGAAVATAWSSTADFTVIGSAGAGRAILASPVGGATVSSLKPTFYWWFNGSTDEIDGYEVTYSRTAGYPGGNDPDGHPYTTTIPYTSVSQVSYTVVSDLVPGTTYYWKVRAHYNSGGTYSNWSTDGSFVVNPGASTIMPLVGGPANGVGIVGNSAVFSWVIPAQSSSPLTYDVQYATTEQFVDPSTVSNSSYSVQWNGKDNLGKMVQSGTYIYRISTGDNVSAKKMIMLK
ncbi:MAG: hypothetical protein WCJ01_05635 [Ignavibacteria bacterium]